MMNDEVNIGPIGAFFGRSKINKNLLAEEQTKMVEHLTKLR